MKKYNSYFPFSRLLVTESKAIEFSIHNHRPF